MTKDATADLIGLLKRVADARVEDAKEQGRTLDLEVLCEWSAAEALEALQAENERLMIAAKYVIDAWDAKKEEMLEISMPELCAAYSASRPIE